jgi:CDP-diacylglycerol--glycerol-3-phosphate 3-phosphatidyltransferase
MQCRGSTLLKMTSFKLSLFAFTLLLSPSVASSFVPFSGCLKSAQRASILGDSFKYRMRGGADSQESGSPVPDQTSGGQGNEVLGDETSSEQEVNNLVEPGSQALAEPEIQTSSGGVDSQDAGSPVPYETSGGQGNEGSGDETSSEQDVKSLVEPGRQALAEPGTQTARGGADSQEAGSPVLNQPTGGQGNEGLGGQPVAEPGIQTAVEVGDKALFGPKATSPGVIRKAVPGFPWQKLPNWLTYVRCLAIPAVVALFYVPNRHAETASLFAVASFTDWLDGYLARRWDITSAFGAFLDPVADKLMVSTALILLSGRFGMHVVIPTCIILARELSVSALREWMAQRGLRDLVKVGFQGKVKTALTMLTLTLLLLVPEDGLGPLAVIEFPAKILLYLCAAITVTSGSVYFRAAAPAMLKMD